MEYLKYILKFFHRIRWWIIIIPIIAVIAAWFATRHLPLIYNVKTTIYTGIISGYNIESVGNGPQANNLMDNLLNIITADKTLKQVSIRLFAECMIHGNAEKDNNYIQASTYRELLSITPKEVQALIDKKNEEKTVANLLAYERPSKNNFIYGLLYYNHPFFSLAQLSERIKVNRILKSDMIDISYSASDPGIAYHTLEILNKEFINQYQDLRYGETNNVIKFFEDELERVGRKLRIDEDSLIDYNIDKRIINYGEQTKQVTIMDAEHQMKMQQLLLDYTSTKYLSDFFEQKLGEQAKTLRANGEFVRLLNKITNLNSKIANIEAFSTGESQVEASKELDNYKKQLKEAEEEFSHIADLVSASKSSTQNVGNQALISQWLDQVVLAEKVKAELAAMDIQRQKLDQDFIYFSPIGATLNRKERNIGFTESTYMSLLQSLNQARLRQKNLQMTSATLKVMNPPTYPLNALPTKRKMILFATFMLTILFIVGYFILVEILDRTLRDRLRTEKITGGKVLGAFPGESVLRYRRYSKTVNEIALKYLSNAVVPYLEQGKTNIINLISTEPQDGKSFIGKQLEEYWTGMGFRVKRLVYNKDFFIEDKKYMLAQSIYELSEEKNTFDILLVEYPSVNYNTIPPSLLKEATLNLLITKATRTWKDTDQSSFNKLLKIIGNDSRLFIYLNEINRDNLQEFTGQLPPYTRIKNMIYRLSQFGLTAQENEKL